MVGKDIKKNILIVSQNPKNSSTVQANFKIENTNWIAGLPDASSLKPLTYSAQIRYHGELLKCKLNVYPERSRRAEIIFEQPVLVAPGQSIVIYDGTVCLGGGVVI